MASNLQEMCGHNFRSTKKMVQMDFLLCSCAPQFIRYSWRKMDQIWPDGTCQTFQRRFSRSRPKPKPRFFTIWGFSKLLRVLPCTHVKPLALLAPTVLSKPLALAWHCFNRGKTNFNVKGSNSHLNHWIGMKQFFFHGCLYSYKSYKSQFRIRSGVL